MTKKINFKKYSSFKIGESFEVFLIPFTLENTTLGEKRIGDEINLEIDIFARYLLESSNFLRS